MSRSTILLATIAGFILQSDITSAHFPILSLEVPSSNTSDFISLATEYGYPATRYEVITDDGYILTLFHIPGRSRFPVFLLHGILDSSDTWMLRDDRSLAVALANKGYDLWFGNSRGNRYSRRHVQLDPDSDEEFWEFSFHEVGHYDIPAFIDRILQETGAESLTAIAHSQGTTAFFVFGSTRPEYNGKVNVMISLAPVCYFKHSVPPLSTLFKLAHTISRLLAELNLHEFLGDRNLLSHIYRIICSTPVIGYAICVRGIFFPLAGYDPAEFEPSFYPTTVMHYPAGTSTRSLAHYLQVGHTNVFAPYDEDFYRNKDLYNATSPQPYDLSKNTMPIALIAGRNDRLSMIPDVISLKQQLPNVVYYAVSSRAQFNHLDDVWGRRMHVYLFPYIFEILQRYNDFNEVNNEK